MTRLGATRRAGVIGIVLAIGMVVATLPSPPDYLILPQLPSLENADRLERLMGIEVGAGGGYFSTVTVIRDDLLTGDDDGVRTIMHYRDTPYDLPEGFTTFLDVAEECVRIRVASTILPAADEDRIEAHAAWLQQHVRAFLADGPRDPCLGRPLQP